MSDFRNRSAKKVAVLDAVDRLQLAQRRRWRLALPIVALGCNPASTGGAPPDARGCGDWPVRPGENFVSLDGESQFEAEPFLIVRDGDTAIAWEAAGCDGRTRIGYTRRGQQGSFERPRYFASPNGQMTSNITLARNQVGSLFVAWASWTPGPDPGQPQVQVSDIRIQFATWPTGANGFGQPIELSEPIANALYDKPWMILTSDDGIVIGYSDLRRGGIWAASSTDAGATFRRTLVDATMANLAALCPDGRPGGAFITYFANQSVRLAHTADGGLTWSAPMEVAPTNPTNHVACQDPMCVAQGDEVWISYGRTRDAYDAPVARLQSVHVAHASLGASAIDRDTFVFDATVGADGGEATGYLLFPQLARHNDGSLGLAAYQTNGPDMGSADLVYKVSTDGGRAFGKDASLATGLTPSLQRHVPNWLGDYFGWSATPAGFAAAFIDNASGISHVVFRETTSR